MEAGRFVLRKATTRGEWSRISKKGKKERRGIEWKDCISGLIRAIGC